MHNVTEFTDTLKIAWDAALSAQKTAWPFMTYAWHRSWHAHFGNDEKLIIFLDTEHHVLIPLSVVEGVAHFTGGEEVADYLDAIGNLHHIPHLWDHAIRELKSAGVSEILLRNIPEGSETVNYFKSVEQADVTEEDTTPTLTLPATFPEYLATLGRKERHEIRRKMRRFEETYPATTLEVREQTDIPFLLTLMKENPDKQTFLRPDMEKFFAALPEVTPETIRQAVLSIDGDPVATTLLFDVDDSLLLYNSGYRSAIEGAGWILKAKLIEWAVSTRHKSVNFLQGGERYKYDFGAVDFPVYRVQMPL